MLRDIDNFLPAERRACKKLLSRPKGNHYQTGQ
jgi:hypothetical protein